MEQRLQKILSEAGVCSRRKAEEYLLAGRVSVNGNVAALGDKADPDRDRVAVDGRPLSPGAERTYLMLHKPRGYVTTLSDEKGRKTVAQLVADCPARVWPVGRLDMDSEGLLLLTDDGELTHLLTHPSHEVEKEYRVHVAGDVAAALPMLRRPIRSDGEVLTADRVEQIGPGCADGGDPPGKEPPGAPHVRCGGAERAPADPRPGGKTSAGRAEAGGLAGPEPGGSRAAAAGVNLQAARRDLQKSRKNPHVVGAGTAQFRKTGKVLAIFRRRRYDNFY